MDMFNRLCDLTSKPIRVEHQKLNVIYQPSSEDEEPQESDEDECNEAYIESYKWREYSQYADVGQPTIAPMSDVTSVNDLVENENGDALGATLSNYAKYNFGLNTRQLKLLIDNYKDEILGLVKTNMVVIIHGPTGCGKSTQVPQYILDDCRDSKEHCNIVVTQPRRIAAISLARRVCEERGWSFGTVCGYQVGLERETMSDTMITYMTTGVLLQKIINAKNLHEFTHIIIDEVHERNQDMDFLLLIIRKFMHLNSNNVKVILMSATFDTEKFSHYFKNYFYDQVHRAPTIFIEQKDKKQFQVQEFFADTLSQIGEIPDFNELRDNPRVHKNFFMILKILITAFDKIELGNKQGPLTDEDIGNVLVFLPGIMEIEEVYRCLTDKNIDFTNKTKWYILPLHSSIGLEEQKKVFAPPPPNHRKIILSTNIAESSLTVSDIGYVIDFCLTKTLVTDPVTQYSTLQLRWASRANCIQRAGRVGRVRDGRVYRFVTRNFYSYHMEESLSPEILRAPLERIILSAKMLELPEPPKAILSLAIDPPDMTNIDYSIKHLKEVGGLLRTCKGAPMKSDGDLTFLGRVMSSLPLDIKLTKLIVLGHMFSCLNDCVIMAAGCSLSQIFTTPFGERLKAYTNKILWADGSCSDPIAYLHLYKVWQRHRSSNVFRNKKSELSWAMQNYLSLRSLREWQYLIDEIRQRLNKLGIREEGGPTGVLPSETYLMLKIIMCGAFYPNYFVRSVGAGQVDEKEAVKVLCGRDPFRTVYFRNMEFGHPVQLYTKRIKEFFDCPPEDLMVGFDSSKIFVEFLRDLKPESSPLVDNYRLIQKIPGKVYLQVYRAVKKRQLKIKHVLLTLSKEDGWKIAKSMGIEEGDNNFLFQLKDIKKDNIEDQVLPTTDTEYISITVSNIIDAGHFWAQNNNEQTAFYLKQMEVKLNKKGELKPLEGRPKIGEMVAGPFEGLYYRCVVLLLMPFEKNKVLAQVLFVDFGNTSSIDVNQLRVLPEDAIFKKPGQAIECELYGVQPSHILNPRGLWTPKARELLEQATKGHSYGKVYSVVRGIVHLELFPNASNCDKSINQILLDKGLAQPAEESFLSKENHKKRQNAINSDECGMYGLNCMETLPEQKPDLVPPPLNQCKWSTDLKGPFSPLEMKIYNCVRDTQHRDVDIDPGSVNSVLLDVEPQDPHERLVVAAQIHTGQHSGKLSIRNTSVMPNIHGFPMMMALIFCPMMEPKILEDGSRIAQILCGLGTQQMNKPFYPEHDIILTLDTELSADDILKVNEIRYWMNKSLETMQCLANQMPPVAKMSIIQSKIYESIMYLLKRNRQSVQRVAIKCGSTWKRHVYRGEILQAGDASCMKDDVWPLHWTMRLKDSVETTQIQENLEALKDMASRVIPMNEITCKLCNVSLDNIQVTRVHLASAEHIRKEKEAVKN